VLELIQERTTMTDLTESAPARPCRAVWASPDERDAAIHALVQHLLIHLPGLSAATRALSLTGNGSQQQEQEAS
jgi:hypothetical protein